MKKIIFLILTVALILSFSVVAYAEEKIEFYDGMIEITSPEGYVSIWKDMPEDAVLFEEFDLTKEEALEILEDEEIYMCTIYEDCVIYVYVDESDLIDYDDSSEKELQTYMDTFEEYYSSYEFKLQSIEKKDTKDFVYIKSVCVSDSANVLWVEYETVYCGLNVLVSCYLDNETTAPEEIEKIDAMIESIKFNIEKEEIIRGPIEYSFACGVKATIPEEWSLFSDYENFYFLDYNGNKVGRIFYTKEDIWEENLTDEEKGYLARSGLDFEAYVNDGSIAEYFNADGLSDLYNDLGFSYDLSTGKPEVIGGKTYYSVKATVNEGVDLGGEVVFLMYVDMGIMHMYGLLSEDIDSFYGTLCSVAESAVYPEIEDEGGENAWKTTKTGALYGGLSKGISTAALWGGIIWFVKKIVNKIKGKNKKQPEVESVYKTEEETAEKTEERNFCTECGAQLEDGDKFCPVCGTKVK